MKRNRSAIDGAKTVKCNVVCDVRDFSFMELMAISSSKVRTFGRVLLPTFYEVICFLSSTLKESNEAVATTVIVNGALLTFIPTNDHHFEKLVL